MNIHPVDSTEHMLNPNDIFLVAAHEQKLDVPNLKQAAKKAGVSEERLVYTLFLKEFSDPRLIRIRSGNTMFSIAAFPERTGFVRAYNGDTGQNFINNLVDFFHAARKIGFDQLIAQPNVIAKKAIKIAMKQVAGPDISSKFDSSANLFVIKTGKPRP